MSMIPPWENAMKLNSLAVGGDKKSRSTVTYIHPNEICLRDILREYTNLCPETIKSHVVALIITVIIIVMVKVIT